MSFNNLALDGCNAENLHRSNLRLCRNSLTATGDRIIILRGSTKSQLDASSASAITYTGVASSNRRTLLNVASRSVTHSFVVIGIIALLWNDTVVIQGPPALAKDKALSKWL
jgi:hypothetical protein